MDNYIPPFSITNKTINLISEISEKVANIIISEQINSNPHLRKNNRIRTIQASLAIENNSLSLEQVTEIIGGKHIIGAAHEIKEVKNAYQMYEHLQKFNPYSIEDLLNAHKILMKELVNEAGEFRHKGVGIANNERIIHIAPPAENIQWLMKDLFQWLKDSKEHILIKSCIFHYEFEFIHPFSDGNGRMGRFWQTLLLNSWKPIFAWLPIETIIKENQAEYYSELRIADSKGDSTSFIEFMLSIISNSLNELEINDQVSDQVSDQVKLLLNIFKTEEKPLSLVEIMQKLGLSHKASFRKHYLIPTLEKNLVEMTIPDKPNSRLQKYRLTPKGLLNN